MATLGQILSETGYGMPRAQDLARRNMEEQEAQYRLDQSARINEQNRLSLASLRRQEDARRRMAQGPTTLPGASFPAAPGTPAAFAGYPNLSSGAMQAVAPAPLPAAGAPAAAAAPQLSGLEEFRRTERASRGVGAGLATPPSAPVSPYAAPAIAPSPVRTMPGYTPGAAPVPTPPRADQSRAGQIISGIGAQSDIAKALTSITTKLGRGDYGPMPTPLGNIKGFFTDNPQEAQARARGVRALDWFQSSAAKEYFRQNPDLVGPASVDPIGFAERFVAEGNVPAAKGTAAAPAAAAPTASPGLVAAMIQVESVGKPSVVSDKGAVGLMQVLPTTAMKPGFGLPNVFDFAEQMGAQVGKRNEAEAKRLLADPAVGAGYGQQYMNAMLRQYNGNLEYALAAYNAGPGAVNKWLAAGADPSKLPKETREYIPKVLAALNSQAPTAAAPGAAPAAPAGPAVQLLAPTAGVTTEKAPTKATEFYTANQNAITADRKILDQDYERMRGFIQTAINNQQQVDKQAYDNTRAALAQQFTSFMQAGIPTEAQRVRAEVVKLDSDYGTRMNTTNTDTQAKLIELDTRYRTGRLMVDGMDAVTRLEYGNDPRALEQVLSFHTGQPVTFQPVADGTFIMSLNGAERGTYTRKKIGDMAKEYFDVEWRKAKAASEAEFAKLGAKSRAEQTLEIVKGQVGMIREAAVKMIEGNQKVRELEIQGRKIKITPTGDGNVIVSSEDGVNLGVLDLRPGEPQNLNGVSIPSIPRVVPVLRQ